jgi:hypothetical protein
VEDRRAAVARIFQRVAGAVGARGHGECSEIGGRPTSPVIGTAVERFLKLIGVANELHEEVDQPVGPTT